MSPQELIDEWGAGDPAYSLSEGAGAHSHFMDLCSMLCVSTPGDADNYCFKTCVTKTGSGRGFADVWKRDHLMKETDVRARLLALNTSSPGSA